MSRTVVALLAAWMVVCAAQVAAGDEEPALDDEALYQCRESKDPVRVSFKEQVSVKELVTWAMGFTCKNFAYDSTLAGLSKKIVLVTPREMSAKDAWKAFLVALRAMGLTVVQKGEVLEVVQSAQAKRHLPKLSTKTRDGERFQRAIFRAEHVPIGELERALSALKSAEGEVMTLSDSDVVLVADFGSHLRGMEAIVREIDRPRVAERVFVIHVEHGDPAAIAATLEAIVGVGEVPAPVNKTRGPARGSVSPSAPASVAPTKILTDERSRSIIVVGSDAAYQRAQALVRRLDVAMDEAEAGLVHMYMLEHADAEALATTLQALVSNMPQPPRGDKQPSVRKGSAGKQPSVGGGAIRGEVRVTFDSPSNALLVMATTQDYLALREVIRRLDTRRAQVFIEATILDIRVEGDRQIQTGFHGGEVKDGAVWLTGLQYDKGLRTTELSSVLGLGGLLTGVIGEPLLGSDKLLGKSIPSFAVLFQALATSKNANILSAPRVMTMDNAEALISVGQRVPVVKGSITAAGASGPNVTQSIDREDVSLTLRVTPHVNSHDEVRLDIELNIEDILDQDPSLGPTTSKREVKNTVVVGDQESIVIGGLVSDELTENEAKIPLLGDIPLLGFLFRRSLKIKRKRNLLILLTPYVVTNRAESETILREKLREREEFASAFSTLESTTYDPTVDYRRKRGLVEEINRRIQRVEEEAELMRQLDEPGSVPPSGRIWPPEGAGQTGAD